MITVNNRPLDEFMVELKECDFCVHCRENCKIYLEIWQYEDWAEEDDFFDDIEEIEVKNPPYKWYRGLTFDIWEY